MSALWILFGFAAAGVVGWLTLGQARAEEPRPAAPSTGIGMFNRKTDKAVELFAPPATNATQSRADLARRLQALAATTAPTGLSMGAMCYLMAAPPDRAEYVCPTCGGKTLYVSKPEAAVPDARTAAGHKILDDLVSELPACRRLIKEMPALEVTLDESTFCRICRPDAQQPRLTLLIKLSDDTQPRRVEGIRSEDLILIREFLEGKSVHTTFNAGTLPLKDSAARLAELLGLPALGKPSGADTPRH